MTSNSLRAREHLLQRDVGDRVVDQQLLLPLAVAVRRPERRAPPRPRRAPSPAGRASSCRSRGRSRGRSPRRRCSALASLLPRIQLSRSVTTLVAELARRERVAPVAERALGELHDVALVHEGDALALRGASAYSIAARTSRSVPSRDTGLMPMPLVSGKRIFLTPISFCRNSMTFLRLGALRRPLDAGVDVLGVLAEDHHVDLLGPLHRAGHALEVAHRAQADVEVEHLAQRDVERADAAADRRGERALDADEVLAERRRPSRRAASP